MRSDISIWQRYIIDFSFYMVHMFEVDLSAKLLRPMRHIDHHLIHLGFIRRLSSEES